MEANFILGNPVETVRGIGLLSLWPVEDRKKLYVTSYGGVSEVKVRESGTVISSYIHLYSNVYAEVQPRSLFIWNKP